MEERRQAFQCMHCAQLEQNAFTKYASFMDNIPRQYCMLARVIRYVPVYQDNSAVIITSVGLVLADFRR